ncbi:unnamed protein product [Paramecium primaurelia]|uniref:EF-hand domain-containing protein n=1 Tax=Paramecium primaurelia TaxID=5886 RepID=A0A8S1NED3_PARPR|nr:unnamed protein product [Paramecium primaurelia]
MQETNDQMLIIKVANSKPIQIKQFDTPLQIAHRFCNDNNIELRKCKTISNQIIRIFRAYIDEFKQLQQFSKYFSNQEPFKKKAQYSLEEIMNQAEKENSYYSFQQETQLEEKQVNSIPSIDIYKSPKDGIQHLSTGAHIDSKKLEDMSRKLYQNILSPTPDSGYMISYSQTTKNISKLQRQLQLNKLQPTRPLQKSQERLKSKSPHNSTQKSPLLNKSGYFDNGNKVQSSLVLQQIKQQALSTKNQQMGPLRQLSNSRASSIGRTRCKTEMFGDDKLQRISNKLFNLLDNDKDGYISPSQIDLSKISDDILNYLIGILLEIDHNKLRLNIYQFYKLFEQHYEKLDMLQKQRFLSIS